MANDGDDIAHLMSSGGTDAGTEQVLKCMQRKNVPSEIVQMISRLAMPTICRTVDRSFDYRGPTQLIKHLLGNSDIVVHYASDIAYAFFMEVTLLYNMSSDLCFLRHGCCFIKLKDDIKFRANFRHVRLLTKSDWTRPGSEPPRPYFPAYTAIDSSTSNLETFTAVDRYSAPWCADETRVTYFSFAGGRTRHRYCTLEALQRD